MDIIAEYSRALTATAALMLAILGGFLGDQPDRAAGAAGWLIASWSCGVVVVVAGLVLQGRLVDILSDLNPRQGAIFLHAAKSRVVKVAGLVQVGAFVIAMLSVIVVLAGGQRTPANDTRSANPETTIDISATSITSSTHQSWPPPDEIK